MPLTILYRDEHYVAIDKPPGLLVHRSPISRDRVFALQTLRDQLGRHVYPIHRLDRATSGVLLFGLSADAARRLVLAGVTPDRLRQDPCQPEVMARLLARLRRCLAAIQDAGLTALESATEATARTASELVRFDRALADADAGDPDGVASAVDGVGEATRRRLADWGRHRFTQTELRMVGSAAALSQGAAELAPSTGTYRASLQTEEVRAEADKDTQSGWTNRPL